MSFLNPGMLFLLPISLFPLLLHLLGRRLRRRLEFPWVKLLFAVETEGRKRSRLYEIILLIVRILAIACLILALSRPVLMPEKVDFDAAYLDVSMSMKPFEKELGRLYDDIKNNFPDKEVFFFSDSKLDQSRPRTTHRGTDYGAIDPGEGLRKVLVYSDFQRGGYRNFPVPGKEYLLFRASDRQVDNVALLAFYSEEPYFQKEEPVKLSLRAQNFGKKTRRGRIRILGGQDELTELHLELPPDSGLLYSFTVKSGSGDFTAFWIPGDSIPGDDTLYLHVPEVGNRKVLLLRGGSDPTYVEAALRPRGFRTPFELKVIDRLDFPIGQDRSLIVMANRLSASDMRFVRKYLNDGGKILAFVSTPEASVLGLLGLEGTRREKGKSFVGGEGKKKAFSLANYLVLRGGKTLLEDQSRDPVAVEKEGSVVVGFKPEPEMTDLIYSPLFPPWLHKLLLKTMGIRSPIRLRPGESARVPVTKGGEYELLMPDGTGVRIVPEVEAGRAFLETGPLEEPGFYRISRDGKPLAVIVVNPDPSESDVTPLKPRELSAAFGKNHRFIGNLIKGARYLSRTLLLAALLLFLLETALLFLRKRFFT